MQARITPSNRPWIRTTSDGDDERLPTTQGGWTPTNDNTFTPGPTPNTVRSADGKILTAPDGWVLLPPGDAALTRRVKAAGEHWVVKEKKGRKVFSRGVWAPAATIEWVRAELKSERSTESYAKRKEADARRNLHPGISLDQIGEDALMVRRQMLYQDEATPFLAEVDPSRIALVCLAQRKPSSDEGTAIRWMGLRIRP